MSTSVLLFLFLFSFGCSALGLAQNSTARHSSTPKWPAAPLHPRPSRYPPSLGRFDRRCFHSRLQLLSIVAVWLRLIIVQTELHLFQGGYLTWTSTSKLRKHRPELRFSKMFLGLQTGRSARTKSIKAFMCWTSWIKRRMNSPLTHKSHRLTSAYWHPTRRFVSWCHNLLSWALKRPYLHFGKFLRPKSGNLEIKV